MSSEQKYITELDPNDILLGRGAPSVRHEGNKRFRQLILERLPDYIATCRHHLKDKIAREVVETVHKRGGRFLRKLDSVNEAAKYGLPSGVLAWLPATDDGMVLEKVKQAFRDTSSVETCKQQAASRKRDKPSTPTTHQPPHQQQLPRNNFAHAVTSTNAIPSFPGMPSAGFGGMPGMPFMQAGLMSPFDMMQPPSLLHQAVGPTANGDFQRQLAVMQLQRMQASRESFAQLQAMHDPQANLLSEIPRAYQNLVPVLESRTGAPFTRDDMMLLLRARVLCETNRDAVGLVHIRNVLVAVLQDVERHNVGPEDVQLMRDALVQIRTATESLLPMELQERLLAQGQGQAGVVGQQQALLPAGVELQQLLLAQRNDSGGEQLHQVEQQRSLAQDGRDVDHQEDSSDRKEAAKPSSDIDQKVAAQPPGDSPDEEAENHQVAAAEPPLVDSSPKAEETGEDPLQKTEGKVASVD